MFQTWETRRRSCKLSQCHVMHGYCQVDSLLTYGNHSWARNYYGTMSYLNQRWWVSVFWSMFGQRWVSICFWVNARKWTIRQLLGVLESRADLQTSPRLPTIHIWHSNPCETTGSLSFWGHPYAIFSHGGGAGPLFAQPAHRPTIDLFFCLFSLFFSKLFFNIFYNV